MDEEKLKKWINDYISDCRMAVNISSITRDSLAVSEWNGRIKALEHLKESINEGELN